jgi:hypothetical protein
MQTAGRGSTSKETLQENYDTLKRLDKKTRQNKQKR